MDTLYFWFHTWTVSLYDDSIRERSKTLPFTWEEDLELAIKPTKQIRKPIMTTTIVESINLLSKKS